jgi:hypothetical protein
MALQGFPEKIKVRLGNYWQAPGGGVGNKLERYGAGPEKVNVAGGDTNTLDLTKVPGMDYWTEDGTNTPNSSSNRVQFWAGRTDPTRVFAQIDAATTPTGTMWHGSYGVVQFIIYAFSPFTTDWYSFRRIWNIGSPGSVSIGGGSPYVARGNYSPNLPSFYSGSTLTFFTTGVGNGVPFFGLHYVAGTFELMEEYISRGQDKTTYRYG